MLFAPKTFVHNCTVLLMSEGVALRVVKIVAQHGGKPAFEPEVFLAKNGLGRKMIDLKKNQTVFSQGDEANAVFYIRKGRVKLTVISKRGKEATIAILGAGDFLGEECIAAIQPQRMASAAALTPSTVLRIDRKDDTLRTAALKPTLRSRRDPGGEEGRDPEGHPRTTPHDTGSCAGTQNGPCMMRPLGSLTSPLPLGEVASPSPRRDREAYRPFELRCSPVSPLTTVAEYSPRPQGRPTEGGIPPVNRLSTENLNPTAAFCIAVALAYPLVQMTS
jgi:hypothetical protein